MISFWGVGFAGGLLLAFYFGLQGAGIWAGLSASSLMFGSSIGIRLLYRWRGRSLMLLAA